MTINALSGTISAVLPATTVGGAAAVQVTWTSNGASQTITGLGAVPASGTQTVVVSESTTFLLTMYDGLGNWAVQTALVQLPPLPGQLPPSGVLAPLKAGNATPGNWTACDGSSQSAPNLSQLFTVAAGNNTTLNINFPPQTWNTVAATHSHTTVSATFSATTSSDPNHTHQGPSAWSTAKVDDGTSLATIDAGSVGTATSSNGEHTHPVKVVLAQVTTNAQPVDYVAYYPLAWAMKT